MDVAKRRIVITGGTSGLGLAMAQALVEGGAVVVVTGRDAARGEQAQAQLRQHGEARFLAHDATDETDWARMMAHATLYLGGLDALFNNVGVNVVKPFDETDFNDFMKLSRINLHTTFLGVKAGADLLRDSGGAIVNTASMAALYANAFVAPYCAAKAMVGGLTRAAAAELAPYHIRVNAIYPGMFMTELTERLSLTDAAAERAHLARIPLRRFGLPEELGPLARFLVSDQSAWISGADFIVDGGRTAW